MFQAYCLGILLCVASSLALYDSSSDVVELTPSNFDRLVTKSDDVWLVEFYAPWCGHCKNLVPEYKKAATALKGIVHVGAVDADQHKSLGSQFGVTGFPTIKIFKGSKHTPYSGQRTAKGLVEGAISAAKDKAFERLGAKPSGSGKAYGHQIPWKGPAKNSQLRKKKMGAVKWKTPRKQYLRQPDFEGWNDSKISTINIRETPTKSILRSGNNLKKKMLTKSILRHVKELKNKLQSIRLRRLEKLQAHLFRRDADSGTPKIIKYQSLAFSKNNDFY